MRCLPAANVEIGNESVERCPIVVIEKIVLKIAYSVVPVPQLEVERVAARAGGDLVVAVSATEAVAFLIPECAHPWTADKQLSRQRAANQCVRAIGPDERVVPCAADRNTGLNAVVAWPASDGSTPLEDIIEMMRIELARRTRQ